MTHLEEVQLQLSEVEVLESIYPNKDEVVIDNHDDFMLMKQFVETDGASFPPTKKLNILINLKIKNNENRVLKIKATLPIDYPLASLPQVFLRCDCMTRSTQQQFNEDLQTHINSIELGETCLYQILQWAAHQSEQYINSSDPYTDMETAQEPTMSHSFIRLWIYSHHIYNKEKRKSILEWAKELGLTGFCMPGKPGIVCVEGIQENCEEYWQRLRRQTWKRLSIVHREEIGSSEEEFKKSKKFPDIVAEKDFGVHGGRDYHMDLGKFFKFLKDHSCQDMFQLLFGVEGKISDKT